MADDAETKEAQGRGPVRVVVLAPAERDAKALGASLGGQFDCVVCSSMTEFCAASATAAAALVIACEELGAQDLSMLSSMLRDQPAWSHLPVIVLTHEGFSKDDIDAVVNAFDSTSPTLLERPVQSTTLMMALRSALHARRRQYEIRDQLAERERHNFALRRLSNSLEKRLRERTVRLETLSQRLRLLAARLTDREHRERRRLAQLIHDHLQQSLVGAKIRVTLAGNGAEPALKEQLRGAVEMIDDGLRVARSLTAELRPPVLYEVGLPAALRWLASQFLDHHSLSVRLSLDEDANLLDERLRALLFDAVRELLHNVAGHAGADEATVMVRRERSEMHASVQDRGRGFDVSVIDPSASPDEQFGLFSIRERVRAVGGQFTIVSSIGHGTRVDLFLPIENIELAAASASDVDDSGVLHPAHRGSADGERVLRVLLADDHQIVREGIASILSAQPSIEVVAQARDGEEAVSMARRLHPDVIVMDVNMPRMNGIEATRRILSEQPDTPIIGLSVQDETGTADAMLRAGATAYLFKGGDPGDLVRCILSTTHADSGGAKEPSQ